MPRCHISQDLKARILILFYEQEPHSKGDMHGIQRSLVYSSLSYFRACGITHNPHVHLEIYAISDAADTYSFPSFPLLVMGLSDRRCWCDLPLIWLWRYRDVSTAHNLFRILKLRNAEGLLCARTEEDIFKEEFDRLRSTEKMFSSTNVWGPPARRQRRSWGDSKGRTGGLNQLPPTSVYYCSSGIKELSN